MAIKRVIYKEPASYFTKEMLEAAEKWDREHAEKNDDKPKGAKKPAKKGK